MRTLSALSLLMAVYGSVVLAQPPSADRFEKEALFRRMFDLDKVQTPKPPKERSPKSWPLFSADQLPAGSPLNEAEAAKLSVGNYVDRNFYFKGNFFVTAAGEQHAVLRFVESTVPIRIIVEYPPGNAVPEEATKITLDESRGMLLRNVGRAKQGGGLILFAREILRR